MPEGKDKNIIDVPEGNAEWALWKRIGAHLINASGTFLWLIVTYILLVSFNASEGLVALRDAMMNITVPSTAYGILSLIAGLSLITWWFPYFSPRRIMKEGQPVERAACLHFWGLIAFAIAIIVAAGIK
jgi:hypothetical protein